MLAIPEALAVGASYGLTVLEGARPAAQRFALFIVSMPAQDVFVRHGFTPVGMP
jgi:ABC-type molybdate transport system substrate-binding protein